MNDIVRRAGELATRPNDSMPLATTETMPGRTIERTLGLVRGSSVRARHIGGDIMALFGSIVGGEIDGYTKILAETREQALDRLRAEAAARGADAVVGLRITTSAIMGGAAEILAYGTAVKLAETP